MTAHLTPDELSEIDAWVARGELPDVEWIAIKLAHLFSRNEDFAPEAEFLHRLLSKYADAADKRVTDLDREVTYLRDTGKAYRESESDLRAKLETASARIAELTGYTLADRVCDVADDVCGLQPVQTPEEALSALSKHAYEGRCQTNRDLQKIAQLERELDDANTTIAVLRMTVGTLDKQLLTAVSGTPADALGARVEERLARLEKAVRIIAAELEGFDGFDGLFAPALDALGEP